MIYLDAATTLKPNADVIERAQNMLDKAWGNVSGSHGISRDAKYVLEEAREKISNRCGVSPDNIVFTSGATEALNIAIQGFSRKDSLAKIFCSTSEHDAVLNTCNFLNAELLKVDAQGSLSLDGLNNLNAGDLVCVMAVNNETGLVQDIEKISEIAKSKGAHLLVDAVQSAYSFDPIVLCSLADFVVYSGHKLGALQGVGVLVINDRKAIDPLSFGGSQEWELRPGTTPAYLCDSMANVFDLNLSSEIMESNSKQISELRDYFESEIKNIIADIEINSSDAKRSPHVSSISFKGVESQILVTMLDERGICVSKGSACASGASTPSHVLVAMGMSDDEALSTIRISFSSTNTKEEIDVALEKISECVKTLRSFSVKLVNS